MSNCVLCNGFAKRVYDDGYCDSCMTAIIEANLELDLAGTNPMQPADRSI